MSAGETLRAQLDEALHLDGGDAEWDEREKAQLGLAQRQADDIERLEELLDEQGSTVMGSQGQSRLNPVFGELRQSRLALSRILGEIRLPSEGLDGAQTGVQSAKAQRAAQSRWRAKAAG